MEEPFYDVHRKQVATPGESRANAHDGLADVVCSSHRYYANVPGIEWPPEVQDYNEAFTRMLENIKKRHDAVVTTVGERARDSFRRDKKKYLEGFREGLKSIPALGVLMRRGKGDASGVKAAQST